MKKYDYHLFLYDKVADLIATQIKSGVLKAGARIPSVRRMSADYGVSIITVLKAYSHLEERGLITAQPRSGFRVTVHSGVSGLPKSPLVRPEKGASGLMPLAQEVLNSNRNINLVPFGRACLSNELLPIRELRWHQARLERTQFEKIVNYETWAGTAELREALSRRSNLAGTPLNPEKILITSGGTQAMYIAIQTALRHGRRIAVESPCYFGTLWSLEKSGADIIEVPTTADQGVRLDLLEKLFHQRRVDAAILHSNFQNPLGSVMPEEGKIRAAELANHYRIPIIEADMTSDLYLGTRRPKLIQAFDRGGWILAYSSFSKLVAPGFRVGSLGAGRFFEAAQEQLRAVSLATATGPQLTLAKFMADGGYDRHLSRLRRHFQSHIPRAIHSLKEVLPKDTLLTSPTGGYLLWLQLPDNISAEEVWKKALRAGISVTPGNLFSHTGKFRSYLRLNLGMKWSPQIEAAFLKLGQIVERSRK